MFSIGDSVYSIGDDVKLTVENDKISMHHKPSHCAFFEQYVSAENSSGTYFT